MQSQSSAFDKVREWITKYWSWLSLSLLIAFTIFLRCLHLLVPINYYILSPDSHFFHWLARRIMANEGPPVDMRPDAIYTLHTGLAYPIAYIAKAVSFVFNLSSTDSLDIVCKFIPPLMGVVSLIVIYLVATRIWNTKVGLFCALVWSVCFDAIVTGAAGYLDREGLTLLLLMSGAFLFYICKDWKLHIGAIDVGWLVSGLAVLLIEALLYLEWTFIGPLLLLSVIIMYFLAQVLIGYGKHVQEKYPIRRLMAGIREASWRPIAFIVAANIVVIIASSRATGFSLMSSMVIFGVGSNAVAAELQGINIADLILSINLLWIPTAIGLYLAFKNQVDSIMFFACWFIFMLALSLLAGRVIVFAAPATTILSGLGLASLWEWRHAGPYHMWKKIGVPVFISVLFLVSLFMASTFYFGPISSVDSEWQDAMSYIRDSNHTSQDSVIMTQWGWGYRILDMGLRKPFMDNGFYGYDEERMHDVGIAYTTTNPKEAVQIMDKYGADYLIFSKLDLKYAETIMQWAGLEPGMTFPEDSLVVRSLNGQFVSEDGLKVVHRSEPSGEVVILGLTRSE